MGTSFVFAQEKYPSPAITTISPNSGELGKTVELTISGENFLEGAYVSFAPYTGITITATQFLSHMEVRVTITVASDAPIGPRDVTIVNPDGQNYTLNGGLALVEAEPIIDVTPPSCDNWSDSNQRPRWKGKLDVDSKYGRGLRLLRHICW
jgi:hypothetical protein